MSKCDIDFAVSEEDLRAWMDGEIIRLGEWFEGFEITWHRDDVRHWVEIWSEAKRDPAVRLYGRGLMVGEIYDSEGLSLPAIQEAGRKLYYSLRKDYPIKRNLGVRK